MKRVQSVPTRLEFQISLSVDWTIINQTVQRQTVSFDVHGARWTDLRFGTTLQNKSSME